MKAQDLWYGQPAWRGLRWRCQKPAVNRTAEPEIDPTVLIRLLRVMIC
jgi:hypothetical protein